MGKFWHVLWSGVLELYHDTFVGCPGAKFHLGKEHLVVPKKKRAKSAFLARKFCSRKVQLLVVLRGSMTMLNHGTQRCLIDSINRIESICNVACYPYSSVQVIFDTTKPRKCGLVVQKCINAKLAQCFLDEKSMPTCCLWADLRTIIYLKGVESVTLTWTSNVFEIIYGKIWHGFNCTYPREHFLTEKVPFWTSTAILY